MAFWHNWFVFYHTYITLILFTKESTLSIPRQSNGLQPGRKASERPSESDSPRSQDPPPTHNKSVHNLVPKIISGVDPKLKTTLLVTSELKLYHPSFNCNRVKLFKNGNFLIVDDTPKDCAILQNKSKMKAALGPNVKVSLPRAFQSAKKQSHKVLVKSVSIDIKQEEFENMLTQNKITFAKAERFIGKKVTHLCPCFSRIKRDCHG